MSSKTRRSVQHVSFSSSSSSRNAEGDTLSGTPDSAAAAAGMMSSPLSPTRMSRVQEKQQLSNLNDRLAQYIERVRTLEVENRQLSYQIRTSEETIIKERSNMKATYEQELSDARRLLDETSRERAKLQIDAGKYKSQADDALAKVAKLERDFKDSESRRLAADSAVQDLTGKLNTAENQRKHSDDDCKKLRAENDSLKKQLSSCQKQLEEETLLRVDLENRLQSLREELQFNKQLHEQELEETRRKRQTEISQINVALEDQFQQKLADALRDTRAQFDAQMRSNRKDVESMYENKLNDLRALAERNAGDAGQAREEHRRMRSQIDVYEKERAKHQNELAIMEKRIAELEQQMKNDADNYYARLAKAEEENRSLQREITEMIQDYQDLMDTKIQLDVEIEAYRKLLEGEESRLNLTPTQEEAATPLRSGRGKGGAKRKRIEHRETEVTYATRADAKGEVEISEHCLEGQYVKLYNKSEEDVALAGWTLRREANGQVAAYKFHRTFVLRAGQHVTIWSSNAQVKHAPPNELVMKNQTWPVGADVRTSLLNADNEEVAFRESTRSAHSERHTIRRGDADGDDAAFMNGHGGDQRCSIM